MKRFYKEASVAEDGRILLDGRQIRTPKRALLTVPTPALAKAIAAEWAAQGETIDIKTMPLNGFANAAIDNVAPDPAGFAAPLAAYAETDLLCYRADSPPELVAVEAATWDPLLDWARARYDIRFEVATGIVHTAQPPTTIARLGEALVTRDAFALTAMHPLVTIGGSLVAALALAEGAIAPEAAFDATHLDELWQAGQWGEDLLATRTREARKADFLAAARLLSLL